MALNPRQVTANEIGGTTHKVWDLVAEAGKKDLRQLTRSLVGIGRGVNEEGQLQTGREFTRDLAIEFGMVIGILLAVNSRQVIPLALGISATGSSIPVDLLSFFGDISSLEKLNPAFDETT